MLRNKGSSSMQKTYDDCYLICSTAVYFEGQNNEAEALRSWRSALDQIYYHNAYRIQPNYIPKNETERALQESLRNLEMQCKERVDLLETLEKSRNDANKKKGGQEAGSSPVMPGRAQSVGNLIDIGPSRATSSTTTTGWMGDGTVPPLNRLPPGPPTLPIRPTIKQMETEPVPYHVNNVADQTPLVPSPAPSASAAMGSPRNKSSRTPSPDKKSSGATSRVMLTTLRGHKDAKGRTTKPPRPTGAKRPGMAPQASSKAAGLAWDTTKQVNVNPAAAGAAYSLNNGPQTSHSRDSSAVSVPLRRGSLKESVIGGSSSISSAAARPRARTPPDMQVSAGNLGPRNFEQAQKAGRSASNGVLDDSHSQIHPDLRNARGKPPTPPPHGSRSAAAASEATKSSSTTTKKAAVGYPSYRTEFPPTAPTTRATAEFNTRVRQTRSQAAAAAASPKPLKPPTSGVAAIQRRPVPRGIVDEERGRYLSSESNDEGTSSSAPEKKKRAIKRSQGQPIPVDPALSSPPDDDDSPLERRSSWDDRIRYIQKHLPRGVDESAAKQIFNEIVVKGDEVHWDDVAGLDAAKKALKEAVVYPFLRPDLFMGLREPARGMLLFGPPGTGKTMLARAVATESRSTFFAISASSLTSKWLGDSEKLVRALFLLAKALAPSIIFVDEIDSLLSSRGGSSEHESTRRIKTEFLIQWSDLQRAAAGRQQSDKEKADGDATRVLVLAATNTPWAIDEAARRRFVRRQYIPLPESHVRAEQLRTLLGHQKHTLNKKDIAVLVELTDGFSGSDITALAKDAAMGPLRSLGEALLYTPPDEIRPINFSDFESSLITIRPSVSKQGLQEFEDWAKEFGERGG